HVAAAGRQAGPGDAVAELESGGAVVLLARRVDPRRGRLAVEAAGLLPLLAVDEYPQGGPAAGALPARHVGERLLAQGEVLERRSGIAIAERLAAHGLAVGGSGHVAQQHGGARLELDRRERGNVEDEEALALNHLER